MPNWVTTQINITGSEEAIKKLLEYVQGNGDFDFNKVIRMPKSLLLPESSTKTEYLRAYFASLDEGERTKAINAYDKKSPSIFGSIAEKLATPLTAEERNTLVTKTQRNKEDYLPICNSTDPEKIGETYYNNAVKYSASTWYDWAIQNWGTKWNACDVNVSDNENRSADISFDTAWSYAYPILRKLAKKFKELVFDVWYADEDYGYNCGHVRYENGIEDVVDGSKNGEPRYDIAEKVLRYSYEELVNDNEE